MIIYPAVDMLGGKCVRLKQGKPEAVTVYNDDPVDQAKLWEDGGAEFLHLVDLDGALTGYFENLRLVEKITGAVGIPTQLGGGVRDLKTIETALSIGVRRAVLGTALVKDPEFSKEAFTRFGAQILAAVDVHRGRVVVSGWTEETGEEFSEFVVKLKSWGAERIMSTDISTDGMLTGLSIGGVEKLAAEAGLPFIVSGGVSDLRDIEGLAGLGSAGVEGVIVGTALYEEKFSLEEAIAAGRG